MMIMKKRLLVFVFLLLALPFFSYTGDEYTSFGIDALGSYATIAGNYSAFGAGARFLLQIPTPNDFVLWPDSYVLLLPGYFFSTQNKLTLHEAEWAGLKLEWGGRFRVSAGAAIGTTWLNNKNSISLNNKASTIKKKSVLFTLPFSAGLKFRLTDRLSINAEYKWLFYPKGDIITISGIQKFNFGLSYLFRSDDY